MAREKNKNQYKTQSIKNPHNIMHVYGVRWTPIFNAQIS